MSTMVNEVLQWAAIAACVAYVLLTQRRALMTLAVGRRQNGPAVGDRVPRSFSRYVGNTRAPFFAAFVDESCGGCHELLAALGNVDSNRLDSVTLLSRDPSVEFEQSVRALGVRLIAAPPALWLSCKVAATPMILYIDDRGVVASKSMGSRIDRFIQRVQTYPSLYSQPASEEVSR